MFHPHTTITAITIDPSSPFASIFGWPVFVAIVAIAAIPVWKLRKKLDLQTCLVLGVWVAIALFAIVMALAVGYGAGYQKAAADGASSSHEGAQEDRHG